MKIAILGTRGIPNAYGGFEQCAEFLSVGLVNKGHEVWVYNSHNHPYQEKTWNGVNIIHKFDPEYKIGTAGQFIYDLNCILDSRKRKFDVILQLGYTSSSVWGKLLPSKKSVIVTNMDGLEWKRSKYSKKVQNFLKFAEKLGVNTSHFLISDSIGIQTYLEKTYNAQSSYIPYGAYVFSEPNENILKEYSLNAYSYNMLIARLEPENNIDTILSGFNKTTIEEPFIVVGKHNTKYGNYLKDKFKNDTRIQFLGGIYNGNHLDNLRYFSKLYFHGHSVGGTNPSLLEAMASNALICANDNDFNKAILNQDAFYFDTEDKVSDIIKNFTLKKDYANYLKNNINKIKNLYSWETITDQYDECLTQSLQLYKREQL